ncbi:M23 family metallopeptidase [Patescibacteria group bacterium]|nr:M23 family metallopeptidase [Patescibacteria group bacterium]
MQGVYRRPFPFVQRGFPFFMCSRIEPNSVAHVGRDKHAVDFLVPEGTPVCAPRDGVVTEVKDGSDRGGADRAFEHDANYIVIDHTSATFKVMGYSRLAWSDEELGGGHNPVIDEDEGQRSIIIHLAKGSARVKVGDHVRAGQIIAMQGSTGWTYAPHIHFAVYQNGTSVPIHFRSSVEVVGDLLIQ